MPLPEYLVDPADCPRALSYALVITQVNKDGMTASVQGSNDFIRMDLLTKTLTIFTEEDALAETKATITLNVKEPISSVVDAKPFSFTLLFLSRNDLKAEEKIVMTGRPFIVDELSRDQVSLEELFASGENDSGE